MLSKLTFFKIFLLSLLFTGALFWLQMYLSLHFSNTLVEDNYIEKSLYDEPEHVHTEKSIEMETEPETTSAPVITSEEISWEKTLSEKEIKQIYFSYIPTTLRSSVRDYRDMSRVFINDETFENKIQDLTVEFHQDMIDVRWKMKNKTIKIFDPLSMWASEFLALFTHEFAHYLDLYFFSRNPFGDISEDFYAISWESTKTIKRWQDTTDFVSGYAMTNKYEDFAETLTYYMFHNADFQKKAETSRILSWKYKFLTDRLFSENVFVGTDFSPQNEIKPYYWDITKIEIESENFLQYLQKDI